MAFRTARVIPASPSQIFAAFTNQTRLARWWGPNGFTSTFDAFEFAPGGHWHFVMHGPDGRDYKNAIEVTDIDPDVSIVLHHVSGPRYVLTVTLTQNGDGGTLVDWHQEFENTDVAERIAAIVEPANEEVLTRLAAEVVRG
jgi:uncharacterized protein YndB with AHSA1/START domain